MLQKEQRAVDQLQEKLVALETGIQTERDKVTQTRLPSGPEEKEISLPWGCISLSLHPAYQVVPVAP